MAPVTGPERAACALAAVLLAAGCGDLFHGTDWSPCEGAQCPSTSSAAATGGAGTGGAEQVGGAGGSGGGPTSEAQACATYGERVCARLAECIPLAIDLTFADVTDCAARYALTCEAIAFGAGIAYTATELEKCYEALFSPASTCGTFLREAYGQVGNPGCALPGGTFPAGQPCASGAQCQGGRCDVTAGEACGVCASFTPVGGKCTTAPECTPGSTCVGDVCTALGDVDAPCTAHAECFADLACIGGGGVGGGKCAPLTAVGQPCDPAQGGCAAYSVCGPSNTCEPLGMATRNEACGAVTPVATYCRYPSACEVTDPATNVGTCVPLVELGGDCSFDGPYQSACRAHGRCIQKKCVLASIDACTP